MTSPDWKNPILDPLYGEINFDEPIRMLMRIPTIQRMRHVRLSNIDSLDLPSVANISRYEHVLGVTFLAESAGFRNSLSPFDDLAFRSAALLHDWAITSFGHLVEEALQYVGTSFSHEEKLRRLMASDGDEDLGGADLQVLVGRESGIRKWAHKFAGHDGDKLITAIVDLIGGQGPWAQAIAGTIDLDNIDNVCRMAYHMGRSEARELPLSLAAAMVVLNPKTGTIGFKRSAEEQIAQWLETRRWVYDRLMLSERDFAGKLMLLYATVSAYQAGEIHSSDWTLVDHEFIHRLTSSSHSDVAETAKRWLVGELWEISELCWMSGRRPEFPKLLEVSNEISEFLGVRCFVYAIKDKRQRLLPISFDDGSASTFGSKSEQWLVGMGSSSRLVGPRGLKTLMSVLERRFGTKMIEVATRGEESAQGTLF